MTRRPLHADDIQDTPSSQAPPGLGLGLFEARALLEMGAYLASYPFQRFLKKGDGQPVMVLPGFGSGDLPTYPLRRCLQKLGYPCFPWNEGINLGQKRGLSKRLHQRITTLSSRYNKKVTLIGWSLGGIMSRALALEDSTHIRSVITLGSPRNASNDSTNIRTILNWTRQLRGKKIIPSPPAPNTWSNEPPPPVPFSSLYSRTDGVVAWQTCLEPKSNMRENIHIPSSHIGFGFNPLVLYVIADRLAQPEGKLNPFKPSKMEQAILQSY